MYIGVEYERLKKESTGNIHGSGEVENEANTFEDIYKKLSKEQGKTEI